MLKNKHVMFVAVGAAALVAACADKAPTGVAAGGDVAALYTLPAGATASGPSGPVTWTDYPLYAGGGGDGTGTLVGQVRVRTASVVGNTATLNIRYQSTGYCISETHLQVATELSGIPEKNGNPIPGQFDQKGSHDCAQQVNYTATIDLGAGENYVYIAAHAVVSGTGNAVSAASYASGNNLPTFVTGRRDGSEAAITNFPTPRPVVAAWEPFNNTDPSFWDSGITSAGPTEPGAPVNNAATIAHGQWLLTNGADWVWEAFRSNQQLNPDGSTTTDNLLPEVGAVVRMEASITVAAPTTGTFRITCDNGYRVFLNGSQISTDASPANFGSQLNTAFNPASTTDLKQANVSYNGWQSVEAYPVSLNAGANTFVIWGVNEYMRSADDVVFLGGPNHGSNGNIEINPAGCIFGVQVEAVPGDEIGEETAWGAPQGFDGTESSFGNFSGNNWATYFIYKVR